MRMRNISAGEFSEFREFGEFGEFGEFCSMSPSPMKWERGWG
jgi:hypothetical protein